MERKELKAEKKPTYIVSVMADVEDVVRLGMYFDQLGVYRAAKPAGMLRVAMKFLVNILEGSGDLMPVDDHDHAMVLWGALRYPREQLDAQLGRQQCAVEQEARHLYAPAARSITAMRKKIYEMTDEQRARLLKQGEEDIMPAERQAEQKEKMIAMAKAAGIVSDDNRSAEEINAEREALDKEKDRLLKESILAGIKGAGVVIAEESARPHEAQPLQEVEDEFAEFTQVAEEIVQTQPYVRNVEPAEAEPGVVVTQAELRKERKMIDDF